MLEREWSEQSIAEVVKRLRVMRAYDIPQHHELTERLIEQLNDKGW